MSKVLRGAKMSFNLFTARENHECIFCRKIIKKGTQYYNQTKRRYAKMKAYHIQCYDLYREL